MQQSNDRKVQTLQQKSKKIDQNGIRSSSSVLGCFKAFHTKTPLKKYRFAVSPTSMESYLYLDEFLVAGKIYI